jgi:hypothetical protein
MNTQIYLSTPTLGRPRVATRLTLVFLAVIWSTTALGGVLALFGTQSAGIAMARAPAVNAVAADATAPRA